MPRSNNAAGKARLFDMWCHTQNCQGKRVEIYAELTRKMHVLYLPPVYSSGPSR